MQVNLHEVQMDAIKTLTNILNNAKPISAEINQMHDKIRALEIKMNQHITAIDFLIQAIEKDIEIDRG